MSDNHHSLFIKSPCYKILPFTNQYYHFKGVRGNLIQDGLYAEDEKKPGQGLAFKLT